METKKTADPTPKKKKLGADLPPKLVDDFNAWCDVNGYSKGAASEAALKLFQRLPLAIRHVCLSQNWETVDLLFAASESAAAERAIVEGIRRALQREQQSQSGSRKKAKAVPA